MRILVKPSPKFFFQLSLILYAVSSFVRSPIASAQVLTETSRLQKDDYSGRTVMNGFSMSNFGEFWKDWKLITVRYREDTKEMRFTYANDVAWSAMSHHAIDYPDGAIFAKIGLLSERDPIFISSIVPSGAKRYQFMVRDKKKFKDFQGWGYALFNGNGRTFKGEPRANSLACAGCHQVAQNRGDVFSQPIDMVPFVQKLSAEPRSIPMESKDIQFKTVDRKDVDGQILRLIPSHFHKIRSLKGVLQDHLFEGTLNEVSPLLAKDSAQAGMPSVIMNDTGDLFAFAYPDNTTLCKGKQLTMVTGRSVSIKQDIKNAANEILVKMNSYCQDLGQIELKFKP